MSPVRRRYLLPVFLAAVAGVLQVLAGPSVVSAYADAIAPCNDEDIVATNGCREWPFCTYPNPADRHSYIQCNAEGRPRIVACPPLLVWDDEAKQCDFSFGASQRPHREGSTDAATPARAGRLPLSQA
ncbi:carbohydrate-binding module family 14 protein [Kitasatospora sp. NPDC096077]|uniref:carbohydrate-binding module family 14 protein n=1 Tax=Kitasatospora sp. NPDC096077 TaxID=3155544 RepID=UPI00332D00C9